MKENMLCTKTHEYVLENGNFYEVGITDFAIEQLGDIVFIELPEVGSNFTKNEVFVTMKYCVMKLPDGKRIVKDSLL